MAATRYRRNMTTESRGPSSFVRSGLSWADARDKADQWNIEAESEGHDWRYRVVAVDGDHAVQRYTPSRREVA